MRLFWSAIVAGLCLWPSSSFGFNYEREVPLFFQQYYRWEPQVLEQTGFPNPYIGAMTRLRVDDYRGAIKLADTTPPASVVEYSNYITFVGLVKSGNAARSREIEQTLENKENLFLTQLLPLEWIDYLLSRRKNSEASLRMGNLPPPTVPSEADERLLRLQITQGIIARDVVKTVAAYQKLVSRYPLSDKSNELLETMRRVFGADFRLEEILNTPELRSSYSLALFNDRQYKTLTRFADTALHRRYDFGEAWKYVLRAFAISYMKIGQFEKSRQTFFILIQLPEVDSVMKGEAIVFHSQLLMGAGTPFYDEAYAVRELQSVVNQFPISAYSPKLFYELGRFFLKGNQTNELNQVLRQFRRYYDDSQPYLVRLDWEKQLQRVNNQGANNDRVVLDGQFAYLLGTSQLASSITSWTGSRFKSKKPGRTVNGISAMVVNAPLSYQAIWALKEWQNGRADLAARRQLQTHPTTQKYMWMFDAGLGQLALREIDFLTATQTSPILDYNRGRLLLKMGQFDLALEEFEHALGGSTDTLYRIPPGWIDVLYPQVYWNQIVTACRRYQLDPYFVLAILREDSRFERGEIQTRDSTNLFKIKTSVLKDVSARLSDSWSPRPEFMTTERSIKYAVFYLAWLRDNFDNNLLHTIMAYGTDPEVAAGIIHGSKNINRNAIALIERVPYPETRMYIQRVVDSYAIYSLVYPDSSIKFKPWKYSDETN